MNGMHYVGLDIHKKDLSQTRVQPIWYGRAECRRPGPLCSEDATSRIM